MYALLVDKDWLESEATSLVRRKGVPWSAPYLGYRQDAEHLAAGGEIISTNHPPGWVEFDVSPAAQWWRVGKPNYGMVLVAANEATPGRDLRFASNRHGDSSKHAYVELVCD